MKRRLRHSPVAEHLSHIGVFNPSTRKRIKGGRVLEPTALCRNSGAMLTVWCFHYICQCQVSALVAQVALDLITASQTQSHVDVWGCCHCRKALYALRKVEEEVHTGSIALRKPHDIIMGEVGCMEPGTRSLFSSV